MALLQQHYSCCKQQLVFVLLVIVGSCLLFAAAHQEVEVEQQHQRYSKPRRLRDRSQLYQVIDDPNNTNKRGLLNDVVLDETSVEFQHKQQQRRLKSEKIIKKVEKAVYSKEAKSDKASKVYARKSVKSKSEKESKGQFAKKSFKRSKNEKEMNSKSVGLKLKKARQAPSLDTMEIMMSSMSMDFSMSM